MNIENDALASSGSAAGVHQVAPTQSLERAPRMERGVPGPAAVQPSPPVAGPNNHPSELASEIAGREAIHNAQDKKTNCGRSVYKLWE